MKNLQKKMVHFCFVVATIMLVFVFSACSKDKPAKPAALIPFTPSVAIQKSWVNSVSMGNSGSYLKLTPAVVNGKIFIAGSSGKIKAIDSNSGKTLWERKTGTAVSSGLGANNNMLFVGTVDEHILALRQLDGKIVWQKPVVSDVLATPAANDEVVVVKTESGAVAAFAVTDGKVLWRYDHDQPALVVRGNSSPKIVDDLVLCGFADGAIEALNLESGNTVWEQQISTPVNNASMPDIVVDPVIAENVVYAVSYQGNFAALNVKTGGIIWQKALSSNSGFTLAGDNIYVTDISDHVWSLSKEDGAVKWTKDVFAHRGLSAPAVLGNLIAVGDMQGYVHWLNTENGQTVARTQVSGGITAPLIYYNHAVYVFSTTGNLVKFSR